MNPSSCEVAECGDGFVQAGVEACDDGNSIETDECSSACVLTSCGDMIIQPGEGCDDGNKVDTDACYQCSVASCGDGVVHADVEECDDGDQVDGDGCSAVCSDEYKLAFVTSDCLVWTGTLADGSASVAAPTCEG